MLLFFNDTATTEIYTLSLHDALPILSFEHIIENIIYTVNIYKLKNSKDFLKVSILVVDSEQKQGYYFYI